MSTHNAWVRVGCCPGASAPLDFAEVELAGSIPVAADSDWSPPMRHPRVDVAMLDAAWRRDSTVRVA
jgi:hypothetical protein